MNPEDAERVLDLFAEARACAPEERANFLTHACAGNDAVRAEIESLLNGQAPPPDFLVQPAFEHGMAVLREAELHGELKAGETVGDCRVISLLGVGGMGEVYLADDVVLGRRVALKLIQRGRGGTLLSHFRHERRVLAGLTHPNIARLYGGAVTPEGQAYLVMEYVEGERLDHYCNNHRLGISERLALFRKICAAVSYAHQNLVVHRDLKPANIRVTAEGEPKLLDFGIAKLLDTETTSGRAEATITMSGAMTPEYASPEQLRGELITTASDVYSLGVVLYELLCGQRPFAHLKSHRPDELARAICEVEPLRLSTTAGKVEPKTSTATGPSGETEPRRGSAGRLRRRLEGDLDNIVAKALRKEPTRRYTSVAAFSEDIRRHCEGLPVTARKDTLAYRAGKFVRRNKVSVAAAALVMLTLIAGLVITTWQAHLAKQERDRARVAQATAEQQRQQAEVAKKQADRINSFLQRLLTSADPRKPGGKDMKVVDALDNASQNIDHDLAGEPEVLAQVHSTLGLAYGRLQLLPQSEEQARAALAIFRRLHPAGDAVTTLETEKLANTLSMRQRYTEAEPLLRESLAWRRQEGAADEYALARTLLMLATVFASTDRPHDAAPLITEALGLFQKTRGVDSTDYLMAVNLLGNAKLAENDLDGALTQYRAAVAAYDRVSPGNVLAVVPEINICNILFRQDKFSEEEAALEKAEGDCRRSVGENNVYYGTALSHHGQLDFARGDYGQAASLARQSLSSFGTSYPADDKMVIDDELILGTALTRTGRAAEAEPILRKALSDGKVWKLEATDHVLENPEDALGECLLAQRRYAEAEPLLLTGYEKLKGGLDQHGSMNAAASRRLHDLYTAWNKPSQAARYDGSETAAPVRTPEL